ncbi:hypothetical protein GCM10027053_36030 [Intrasporangium mesophilum]
MIRSMTAYERGAEIDWRNHPIDFSQRLLVNVGPEGIDPTELKREFKSADYSHLSLMIPRGTPLPSLEFLEPIHQIRQLDVTGPVRDDTYAFHRTDIRRLSLLTKCQRRIPEVGLTHLEELTLDTRPHFQQIHDLPQLQRLSLFGWQSQELTFLGHMPQLEHLRIEARHPMLLTLDGLERCRRLRDVWLDGVRVASLTPLRELQLTRLWVLGRKGMTQEVLLDLADLAGMAELHDLRIIDGGTVKSAQPLLQLLNPSWLRLNGTHIADGDTAPLALLAGKGVSV